MKKYIYKLSLLTLVIFAFTSCNVDDDDPVTAPIIRELVASAADQNDVIGVPNDTESYDFVIQFSEALPSYSSIEYSVDGVTSSVNANTGATSVTIPLTFGINDSQQFC